MEKDNREKTEEKVPNETGDKASSSKKRKSTKKIVLFSILGVVVIAAVILGLHINTIISNPKSLFEDIKPVDIKPTEAAAEPSPAKTAEPEEEPEPDEESEYDLLLSEADKEMMDGIVNVLLVGVDHAEERDSEKWTGKRDFHADVILVLAINFNENTVDMISIPRDTYANIPGVKGIYKINASLDVGGGMYDKSGAGFKKVCETATWMLGGINIDYYVGVDMNAVKALGDAIGGVDFDLDVDFNLSGRYYKKGYQHMDGQGILDYMRVRKPGNIAASQTGDQRRVNRQKKMLIAVFESMKKKDLLTSAPKIISAFDGNLYTNLSTSQIAALAVFGYNLDSDMIAMHSMGGSGGKIGEWNFVFTNQKNRVDLIKEVYGVDVEKYTNYTSSAADAKYAKIAGNYIIDSVSKTLSDIRGMIGGEPAQPQPEVPAPAPETPAPETPAPAPETPAPETPAPETPAPAPETPVQNEPQDGNADGGQLSIPMPAGGRNAVLSLPGDVNAASVGALYSQAQAAFEAYKASKTSANFNTMKNSVTSLCNAVGYSTRQIHWYYPFDEKYNEIYVDFR